MFSLHYSKCTAHPTYIRNYTKTNRFPPKPKTFCKSKNKKQIKHQESIYIYVYIYIYVHLDLTTLGTAQKRYECTKDGHQAWKKLIDHYPC